MMELVSGVINPAKGAVIQEIAAIARRRHIKAIICSMDSMDLDLVFL